MNAAVASVGIDVDMNGGILGYDMDVGVGMGTNHNPVDLSRMSRSIGFPLRVACISFLVKTAVPPLSHVSHIDRRDF